MGGIRTALAAVLLTLATAFAGAPADSLLPAPPARTWDIPVFDAQGQTAGWFWDFWDAGPQSGWRFEVERYTILDLDRDGQTELILEMNGLGDIYILRRTEAGLCGYRKPYRGFAPLKTDGTYGASDGAADCGWARVAAFGARYVEDDCFLWLYTPYGSEETDYRMDGVSVDEETFTRAARAQDEKEDAVWLPWGGDGVPEEAARWLDEAAAAPVPRRDAAD